MDDGEVEFSDHAINSNPNTHFRNTRFLDEFLDTTTSTCTHTHTCNPPAPDAAAHSHTCNHTHTQVVSSQENSNSNNKNNLGLKPRRLRGNREAVRKYREKKKAHILHLEEEVKKLKLSNQQLVRKLQGQSVLEAEVLRLRCLLIDLNEIIDVESSDLLFRREGFTSLFPKEGDHICGLQRCTIGNFHSGCHTNPPCFDHSTDSTMPF